MGHWVDPFHYTCRTVGQCCQWADGQLIPCTQHCETIPWDQENDKPIVVIHSVQNTTYAIFNVAMCIAERPMQRIPGNI